MYTGNASAADLIWSSSTTPCTVNCWGGALWAHTPPAVSLTGPASNTVLNAPGSLSLTASASASLATVSTVEFFMGGTPVGIDTTAPYTASVSGLPSGQYSFTAVATDNLGARTESAAVTVIVNQPGSDLVWSTASSPCRVNCWGGTLWHASASPAVSISSPANDTIVDSPGSVTLTAGATDSGTVTQVAFYQGATLIGTDTTAPYTLPVSNLAPGGYEFTAVATNNLGATTRSAPVRVMVAAQVYYVQVDHLNTPRLVSNAGGTAVWEWEQAEPFGDSAPNDNPSGLGAFTFNLRFPGQYFDVETGLSYNYFRDYDPAIGRYEQSDLIGLEVGLNTYAHVNGNPISFVDLFGLQALLPSGANWSSATVSNACVVTPQSCACPDDYWDRYLQHVDQYTVNIGPYAVALAGGLWPKSLVPRTVGRGPLLGSSNPLTSVPRALGVPGAASPIVQGFAAAIGVATVGVGFYNIGVFGSGLFYVIPSACNCN